MRDQRTSPSMLSIEHHVLGRSARELRARRALSQEEAGSVCGMHRNYVGSLERGEVNPTFSTLLRLCTGLDIPLSTLILLYEERRSELIP